jgi:three-Cys-motif partner protein
METKAIVAVAPDHPASPQVESTDNDGALIHRFGSINTKLKLEALGKYLPKYTTALKNQPFTLHYVDAFAGTGLCEIKTPTGPLLVPGSASIALECIPRFHRMLFVEKSLSYSRALQRLKDRAPDRDIVIVQDDANSSIPKYIASLNPSRDRAIVFLDPFGMQVEWATLKKLADSKITDVWYLFPLSGVYRQATRSASDIDDDKADALTRVLGTHAWREAFYGRSPQDDLFGGQLADVRMVEVPQILAWVKQRLETIFAGVLEPKLLYQTKQSGRQGAPLFALFFAVSNPRAVALAMRIATGVLKQ